VGVSIAKRGFIFWISFGKQRENTVPTILRRSHGELLLIRERAGFRRAESNSSLFQMVMCAEPRLNTRPIRQGGIGIAASMTWVNDKLGKFANVSKLHVRTLLKAFNRRAFSKSGREFFNLDVVDLLSYRLASLDVAGTRESRRERCRCVTPTARGDR
jgi:hypothetical protein